MSDARYRSDWKPGDKVPWVIREGGYFYRHNCNGYTSSVFEAELFSREYAERFASVVEMVTAHPITEFLPDTLFDFISRIDVMHDIGLANGFRGAGE